MAHDCDASSVTACEESGGRRAGISTSLLVRARPEQEGLVMLQVLCQRLCCLVALGSTFTQGFQADPFQLLRHRLVLLTGRNGFAVLWLRVPVPSPSLSG